MNAITRRKSPKRLYVVLLSLLVAIVIGAGAFFWLQNNTNQDTANRARADEVKRSLTVTGSEDARKRGLPLDTTQTSDEVPNSTSLKLSEVSTSQQNGNVISKATTNESGTCVFLYSSEYDKPVIDEVQVKDNNCVSTLSEANFTRLGVWNLKISFYNNGSKVEAEQDVTIR